uniref:Aldehyde dehydrogenase domain-containing protein n=1 Tax=Chelydra serpentina TaxID=8475 RepID=A0A8C3SJM2_CHESE
MNPYVGLVSSLRAAWLSGKTRAAEHRVSQLEALGRFLDDKKQPILDAMASDMRKVSRAELSEIILVKNQVNYALNNLSSWMKDEGVDKNLVTQLDTAFIRKEPYGVVLIIAPWNYPLHLILVPLVGAIAAGTGPTPSIVPTCSRAWLLTQSLPPAPNETPGVFYGGHILP